MILCSPNYQAWKTITEDLVNEEVAKIQVVKYHPEDYIAASIAMKTLPVAEYEVGDLADWSSGVVTITYQSGRTLDIDLISSRFIVTGFDSLQACEEQEITVTFASNPEISTTFKVKIIEAKEEPIKTTIPGKTSTQSGEVPQGCRGDGCKSALSTGISLFIVLGLGFIVLKKKKENY